MSSPKVPQPPKGAPKEPILTKRSSLQSFIHEYRRKNLTLSLASLKSPITTVSTVNTDRHSDAHNIQRIQLYTLDKLDRNLTNIRKCYDQLKRENDVMEAEIGLKTTERNDLRKREKAHKVDMERLNQHCDELQSQTLLLEEEEYLNAMYSFMINRLKLQEDSDRLYSLQLQRELENAQDDLSSLNTHLMNQQEAERLEDHLLDELDTGREIREAKQVELSCLVKRQQSIREGRLARATAIRELSKATRDYIIHNLNRKRGKLMLARKIYKAALKSRMESDRKASEPLLNLFSQLNMVTGATNPSDVVTKFLGRESTLEAVRATERELEQRILKKQQEVKELNEILHAPPDENLESRRVIYKIIETKTSELTKVANEGEKTRETYSRGLITLDKLRYTTGQLLNLLGYQETIASDLPHALEIILKETNEKLDEVTTVLARHPISQKGGARHLVESSSHEEGPVVKEEKEEPEPTLEVHSPCSDSSPEPEAIQKVVQEEEEVEKKEEKSDDLVFDAPPEETFPVEEEEEEKKKKEEEEMEGEKEVPPKASSPPSVSPHPPSTPLEGRSHEGGRHTTQPSRSSAEALVPVLLSPDAQISPRPNDLDRDAYE